MNNHDIKIIALLVLLIVSFPLGWHFLLAEEGMHLDGRYSDPANATYPPTGISFTFHSKNQVTYVTPDETYKGTYSLDNDLLQLHVDDDDVSFVYDKSNDKIILPGNCKKITCYF